MSDFKLEQEHLQAFWSLIFFKDAACIPVFTVDTNGFLAKILNTIYIYNSNIK